MLISYSYVIVFTGSLCGILPMFMLSKSVAHGELVRRVWGLPLNTHNVLILLISFF